MLATNHRVQSNCQSYMNTYIFELLQGVKPFSVKMATSPCSICWRKIAPCRYIRATFSLWEARISPCTDRGFSPTCYLKEKRCDPEVMSAIVNLLSPRIFSKISFLFSSFTGFSHIGYVICQFMALLITRF